MMAPTCVRCPPLVHRSWGGGTNMVAGVFPFRVYKGQRVPREW